MFDGEHTVHLLVNLLVNNRKNKAYCYLLIFTVVCILYTNLKASTRWGNTFFLFNNSAEHVILNVQYFNFT